MTVLHSTSFSISVSISDSSHACFFFPSENVCRSFCIQQTLYQKKYHTLLNTLNYHITPVWCQYLVVWSNPLQMCHFPVFHFLCILQHILFVSKSSSCCTTNPSSVKYCHLPVFVLSTGFIGKGFISISILNKAIRLSQYWLLPSSFTLNQLIYDLNAAYGYF